MHYNLRYKQKKRARLQISELDRDFFEMGVLRVHFARDLKDARRLGVYNARKDPSTLDDYVVNFILSFFFVHYKIE